MIYFIFQIDFYIIFMMYEILFISIYLNFDIALYLTKPVVLDSTVNMVA